MTGNSEVLCHSSSFFDKTNTILQPFVVLFGLILTLIYFSLRMTIRLLLLGATFPWRWRGARQFIRRHTYLAALLGYGLLGGSLQSLSPDQTVQLKLIVITGCLLAIGIVAMAVSAIISSETTAKSMPPSLERWFLERLRNRRDIGYVRLLFSNSIIMLPAIALVINPLTFGFLSLIVYLFVAASMSGLQESLIHSDVHNHFFRRKHLRGRVEILVFEVVDFYLKVVIPSVSCRIPWHYIVEHAMIHHVENNGVNDIQTTVFIDRKSFFDFCRYVTKLAVNIVFANDTYMYLIRKNILKPIRIVIRGQFTWYALLAVIATFNFWAALALFSIPLIATPARAMNVLFWHGLVDVDDPDNIYTNTINIAGGPRAVHAWHVEHHTRPGEHWSNLREASIRASERHEKEGTIVYSPHPMVRYLFIKAMWLRRFDLLAQLCIPTCEIQRKPEVLAEIIERRTAPLRESSSRIAVGRVDQLMGRLFAKFLVPGEFPQLGSTGQQFYTPAENRTNYVEG